MKKLLLISALVATLGFSSCKEENSASVTKVNVRLTDAPGSYDALMLSIKQIKVLTSQGEFEFKVNPEPFDLLEFRMGKDTLLASQDIPSGKLQEVRLVLNDTGNEVVIDGESFDLKTPSGQSSGVKIKINDELQSGIAYTLKLDFDAAKSIIKTGNGKYILKPVIRAIPVAVSGAITGTISPAASNAKVLAIAGVDTIGAVADAEGKFFFPGITTGTYKIDVLPVNPYQAKSIESVQVTAGSVKDLGTITVVQ